MAKKPAQPPKENPKLPSHLETHEELVANMPAILGRLNEQPELARLVLINPLLVLEDLGITLSEDLQDHIRRTLGFPPGRVRQIAELRGRLRESLAAHFPGADVKLPKTPRERANLLFDRLGLPYEGRRPDGVTVEQLRVFRDRHPIAADLYELGRLERGTLQYQTRGEYERHKAGAPHHSWLRSLKFRKGI